MPADRRWPRGEAWLIPALRGGGGASRSLRVGFGMVRGVWRPQEPGRRVGWCVLGALHQV